MSFSSFSNFKRYFRRRFGIAAPKVGIHSELQWYWRAVLWAVVLTVSIAMALWVYDAGLRFAGFSRVESERERSDLKKQVAELSSELEKTSEQYRSLGGRLQVELSTIEQMTQRLLNAQKENANLKEELALFEGLVTDTQVVADSVKFARVRVEPGIGEGKYRFSVLIVRQAATKTSKDFSGEIQFFLKVSQDGVSDDILIPNKGGSTSANYHFSVKHFVRIEGEFTIPASAALMGGEVRLIQNGVTKLSQKIGK